MRARSQRHLYFWDVDMQRRMLFPNYDGDDDKPRVATQTRLNRLVREAVQRLRDHRHDIHFFFQASCVDAALRCRRKYQRRAPDSVVVDVDRAIDRVRRCRVSDSVSDDCWGECDFFDVSISSQERFTDAELLGTMIHEALHYCATWDGNDIPAHIEHDAMRQLGEM